MILQNSYQLNIFQKFPSILFILLPLNLISGPFLSDLSITLICLIYLSYCIKNKYFKYFQNRYFYIYLIFCFYLIFNSLVQNFNLDSLKISLFYVRFGVFAIAVFELIKLEKKTLKYFYFSLILCFSALIIDGYLQYFFGKNIVGWGVSYSHRVSSFFGEELILGSYISRLWPILFALTLNFYSKNSRLTKFSFFILILSYVLVFFSGERTAFFLINLSILFILFFANNFLKIRLFIFLATIVSVILVSLFSDFAKKRIVNETINQMNLNNINKGIHIFSQKHTHHYITAYKMFLDNKVIGVGVKNFRKFCDDPKYAFSKDSCSTHPHNNYIQLLSETGLIGFLFLFTFSSYFAYLILIHFRKKIKKLFVFTDFEICILSGIFITIWPITSTGNVFNNWLNIIYYLYLPFLIWSFQLRKINL